MNAYDDVRKVDTHIIDFKLSYLWSVVSGYWFSSGCGKNEEKFIKTNLKVNYPYNYHCYDLSSL